MKQYGFAIIGCGGIAKVHAAAIKEIPNAKLIGAFDTFSASAKKFAEENNCLVFATIEELLSNKDVDVVNICVPSGLHAELAVKAANAKKNVIVEKPMAITHSQIEDIISAVKNNGVKMAVISQLRFTDAVVKVKKAIEENRLGKIFLVDYKMKFYRSQEYYLSGGGWRGTWKMDGGGALMNQGIHGIDLIQYLMGGVKTVYADCRTMARDIETEDSAYIILEYNNGAIGSVCVTTVASPGYPREIEIHGEKGSVILEEDAIKAWDIRGEKEEIGKSFSDYSSSHADIDCTYHKLQFEDLISAIEKNLTPLVDEEEGSKPVKIILAAYESSKTGKKVEVK